MNALRQGPSAAIARAVRYDVRKHHSVVLVVVKWHTLQKVLQQLRCHCWVNPRVVGHKCVNVVHTLDVSGSETLTGLPVYSVCFCGQTDGNDR